MKEAFQELSVPDLESRIDGDVILPTDDGYDQALSTFYEFSKKAGVVVRPAAATDVATIVTVARETGTELAVRSGGHTLAGHSATDGGILLDLSSLKEIDIDVEDHSAWAGAGLTAGEYGLAVGEHGLATGFGDTGSVGIGGITLGGGIGLLVRKHGLTIDNLLAAEIVTADGQTLEIDETSHPDLFWAIRGGGGNFGTVTRFKFRLHEVDSVVGGFIILPPTPEVIEGFVRLSQCAPEELTTIGNVMKAPPAPFLPPEVHGKTILFAVLTYAGDTDAGEEVISRFRDLAEPIVDMTGPTTYPHMFPDEGGIPPGAFEAGFHVRSVFSDSFDIEDIKHTLEELESSNAAMAAVGVRVLGGAVDRVPVDATAFAHRNREMMLVVTGVAGHPEATETVEPWVSGLANSLGDTDTAYVNFLADDSPGEVAAAYPGSTGARLAAIKGKYDPDNFFRSNFNIAPA